MRKWSQRLGVPISNQQWLSALGIVAVMCLLFVTLLEGVFSTDYARASAGIASETFNRTVSNGWGTADQGGPWTILDTPTAWSVVPGIGNTTVASNAQERGVLSNVKVQAKMAVC